MFLTISALVGALLGLISHDLASQALHELELRPLRGSCPRCGHDRGWARLVCPKCDRSIGREWAVVALTATAAVFFALAVDVSWLLIPYGGFLLLTAALGLTDVDAMRIVDRLNIRGSLFLIILLGLSVLPEGSIADYWRALAGGGIYFAGAFLLFVVARGQGFGAGDVKLAPLLGVFTAYFGWTTLGRAVVATAIIGGVMAVVALIFSEAKRDTELPYGPAMILGAWVAVAIVGISAI